MQTFSMILPILGDYDLFEDTVASVLRHRPAGTQIIVAHDGKYEDPYDLAGDQVEFVSINRRAKLIRLFNAGVKRATGDIVGFLRPGTELSEGWHQPVLETFSDPEIGSVAPVIVKRGRLEQQSPQAWDAESVFEESLRATVNLFARSNPIGLISTVRLRGLVSTVVTC